MPALSRLIPWRNITGNAFQPMSGGVNPDAGCVPWLGLQPSWVEAGSDVRGRTCHASIAFCTLSGMQWGAPQSRRDGSVKPADQAVARPSWRKLRSGLERGDAGGDRTSQGFEAPCAKQGRLFLVEAGPVALGFQQVPRTHWAVKGRK